MAGGVNVVPGTMVVSRFIFESSLSVLGLFSVAADGAAVADAGAAAEAASALTFGLTCTSCSR